MASTPFSRRISAREFFGARSRTDRALAKMWSRQARNRSGPRKVRGGAWLSSSVSGFSRSRFPGKQENEGSGTPANADPYPPHLAMRLAPLQRAHLSAFHRGSHLREYSIPKAQLQARLPGTRSARALPAFACPSPGMHLPPGRNAGGHDTQAAREQAANPPAGTALAPMTRCASAPCPSPERGSRCNLE